MLLLCRENTTVPSHLISKLETRYFSSNHDGQDVFTLSGYYRQQTNKHQTTDKKQKNVILNLQKREVQRQKRQQKCQKGKEEQNKTKTETEKKDIASTLHSSKFNHYSTA